MSSDVSMPKIYVPPTGRGIKISRLVRPRRAGIIFGWRLWIAGVAVMVLLLMNLPEGASASKKPLRTVRVTVVADQHFSHQTAWERKAERYLADIAQEVGDLLNIKLEVVGYEVWTHEKETDPYRLTERMVREVGAAESDVVIGFTLIPCDSATALHVDGISIPFRGMLIRKYYARCHRDAFLPYVMIHEMVHLLGGIHTYDRSLMSPVFADTIALTLDPLNRRIVGLTHEIDFAAGYSSLPPRKLDRLADLYRQAMAWGNREALTLRELGRVYRARGRCADAIPLFTRALRTDSSATAIWELLADCHALTGRPKRAISLLEAALARVDDAGPVYHMLAHLYLGQGDFRRAAACAARAEKYGETFDAAFRDKLTQGQNREKP